MKPASSLALATALALSVAANGCGEATERHPPNIIFVVLDTARADHFSFTGWDRNTSPFIDALCEQATLYRRARSVAPWTLPSHMSMFTGLLPGEHGATWKAFSDPPGASLLDIMNKTFAFSRPERLLPRRLKDLGYTTLGISNNPWVSDRTGFGEGFDALYPAWRRIPGLDDVLQALPANLRVSPQFDAGRAGRSLLLFRKHVHDFGLPEPFFVFFNFTDAHYPYLSPPDYAFAFGGEREAYRRLSDPARRTDELAVLAGAEPMDIGPLVPFYDGTLLYEDAVIGKLLEWLRANGLYENTMIVITSDHGEHLGEGGRFSHQLSVEEELLRVPLVIKYPHGGRSGTVVDEPLVSTLDLYETILSAAGAPSRVPSHARDLSRPEQAGARALLAEYYYSDAYLGVLAGLNPSFDLDEHRTVRRAVYLDGYKFVFRDQELTGAWPLDGAPDANAAEEVLARARRIVRDYTAGLDHAGLLQPTGETTDPAFQRVLQELGYLGGGEDD